MFSVRLSSEFFASNSTSLSSSLRQCFLDFMKVSRPPTSYPVMLTRRLHLLLCLQGIFYCCWEVSLLLHHFWIHRQYTRTLFLTSFLLLPWMWWLFLMMSSSFTSLSSNFILPSFMSYCVKCLKYLHWHQQEKKVSKIVSLSPSTSLLHFLCLLPVFSQSLHSLSFLHIRLIFHK